MARRFENLYVGKGSVPASAAANGLDIIRLNLHMDELEKLAYDMKTESGEVHRLVTLEVSKMKTPDKFGRSHTVYGSVLVQEPDPAPAPAKKSRKKPEPELVNEDALPF